MSKSCTILAHVRRPNGEVVESRLFNDLLHYTSDNRELAKEYYGVGTSEDFLSQVRDSDEFQVDENGEITLKSLRTLAKLDLDTDKLLQVLNKDIREGEYDYEEAVRKIEDFNNNNEFSDKVIATIFPTASNKYYVTVVPVKKSVINSEGKKEEERSEINEKKKLHDVVHNKEVEKRIINLLRQHGVSVKFLEGNKEGGRYSTENATRTQDGLYALIELSKDGYTTDVLAEEAGHFAVGALGDNPLVKRLQDLLGDPSVQREALGDEEYDNSQLGTNPAREVAGKLVGKALQRKLDNQGMARTLANRIANLAKRVFYAFSGNEVRWAAAKAEQVANKIAYQFVEGNNNFSVENAISISEVMRNATLSVNQKVYKDTVDELGRMVKQLEAIAQDQFTGQMQASLAMSVLSGTDENTGVSALQMDKTDLTANSLAFDGIVQALVQVTDYLGPDKEIDQLMKAVDLENVSDFYANMARNGRYLRQARTFLRSAEIIISTIEAALNSNNLAGSLVLANGSTLTDVRYQDENGTWKSINLKNAIPAYKNIIAAAVSRLSSLESNYFARFCEDIYGSKYITSTVGKTWQDIWHGQKAFGENTKSIADMVLGVGMEDIDVFHRYLGSMANNPDIIGQIADKLVKTANKSADDLTIKYRDRLLILQERAKRLGLNTADLLEKDENGVPTGNMITPPAAPTSEGNREEDAICQAYMSELETDDPNDVPAVQYGKWEKERDEFLKQLWEDFKEENPDWQSMSGFTRGYKWDAYKRPKYKEWNKEHSIKVEVKNPNTDEVAYVKWVPNLTYQSDAWDRLRSKYPPKNGDSIDKWMYDYRQIKEELDRMLPVGATNSYRLPQFRGTFMNSVRQSAVLEKGPLKRANAWRKTFGRRVILEMFGVESEETDYGDMTTMNSPEEELLGTKLNYEEERAARIPVFGVNKLKNLLDLDSDIIGSTIAYASMATSYLSLDSVVDGLEVGAEALFNRKIEGKETAYEKGRKKLGNAFRKATGGHESRATGAKNRAYGRYLKFLEKQVYGVSATYWGIPIGKGKRILLNKVIQNISSLGGSLFLKGNLLGGSVNTFTGVFNISKEALVGAHFDAKDLTFANGYYFKHFPEMWTSDLGRLDKHNKLSLFLEQMNASSDNRNKFRNWKTSRSRINNFYRMLGYLPYSSGDHYMQAMSYLAVAHGTDLYDIDGKKSSNLWDAYTRVKNADEKGVQKGYSLEFSRAIPLDASDIDTDLLNNQGVYLKSPTRKTADFEDWLVTQDARFADKGYRDSHITDYNNYKDKFRALSDEALMKYRSSQYKNLADILQKTEVYLDSGGLLTAVPSFSHEELSYLASRGVGTGNYADILQTVKEDIYKIIWTKADESAYMDKCRETNNRLHGIYNEQDKTAWHQQWYTNAFLAMKGWALGYLEMMYSNNHYSVALDRNVEGFVNTAAKIHASWIKGMFGGGDELSFWDMLITMLAPWSERSKRAMRDAGFSDEQNMNARRMAVSVFLMLLLYGLRLATAPPDKDDDEEADVATGLIHYFAMRTLYEQEALLWLPETFTQSGQLLDFKPVGFSALYDIGKLAYEGVGAVVAPETDKDFYWQRSDKNGRYEAGETKFRSHLERLIPYWKNVWAIQNPYEATENYEFGRKLTTR